MGVCTACSVFYKRLKTASHCNDCYNRYILPLNNQTVNDVGNDNDDDEIPIDGNTALSEISVDDLKNLILNIIKPVKDNVNTIKNELLTKANAHENRLKLLEADCATKQARIDALEQGSIIHG